MYELKKCVSIYDCDNVTKSTKLVMKEGFNDKGDKVFQRSFKVGVITDEFWDYDYDCNGNVTCKYSIPYIIKPDNHLIPDEKNRTPISHICYEYDNHNRILHKIILDPTYNVISEYEYEYDDNGNLINEIDDKHVQLRYKYEYNDDGQIIKTTCFIVFDRRCLFKLFYGEWEYSDGFLISETSADYRQTFYTYVSGALVFEFTGSISDSQLAYANSYYYEHLDGIEYVSKFCYRGTVDSEYLRELRYNAIRGKNRNI